MTMEVEEYETYAFESMVCGYHVYQEVCSGQTSRNAVARYSMFLVVYQTLHFNLSLADALDDAGATRER